MKNRTSITLLAALAAVFYAGVARAADCSAVPTYTQLHTALQAAQAATNGGFGLNMWATVVNRDGFVRRECMHIEQTHIVGEIQLLQYPAKNRMSNRFWIIDNKANGHRLAP